MGSATYDFLAIVTLEYWERKKKKKTDVSWLWNELRCSSPWNQDLKAVYCQPIRKKRDTADSLEELDWQLAWLLYTHIYIDINNDNALYCMLDLEFYFQGLSQSSGASQLLHRALKTVDMWIGIGRQAGSDRQLVSGIMQWQKAITHNDLNAR